MMRKTAGIFALLFFVLSFVGCSSVLPEARLALVGGGTIPVSEGTVVSVAIQPQPSAVPVVPEESVTVSQSEVPASAAEPAATAMDTSLSGAATWNTAYILQTLCNAVNAVKTQTGSVQLTLTRSHTVTMDSCSIEPLRDTAQQIFDKFQVDREDTYPIVNGTVQLGNTAMTANDILTPAGNAFSVPETAVASAKASFDGENVIIRLTLKEDRVTETQQIPTQLAGCFDYIRLREDALAPCTVTKLDASYTGTSVTAGLDAQGRLVLLTVNSGLSGTASGGIGVLTADVAFTGSVSDKWNLTYPEQTAESVTSSQVTVSETVMP